MKNIIIGALLVSGLLAVGRGAREFTAYHKFQHHARTALSNADAALKAHGVRGTMRDDSAPSFDFHVVSGYVRCDDGKTRDFSVTLARDSGQNATPTRITFGGEVLLDRFKGIDRMAATLETAPSSAP